MVTDVRTEVCLGAVWTGVQEMCPISIWGLPKRLQECIELYSFVCVCGGGYMGSYFPYQGSNLHPLHWNGGILTPGPPAKSWAVFLNVNMLVTQSCPTLCEAVDCRPPGSSVHGILQPRIPEWVSSSSGSSWPRVSCIAGSFFTVCATILNDVVLTLYPGWIISVKGKHDSNRHTILNLPFDTSTLPRGSNPLVCWDSC